MEKKSPKSKFKPSPPTSNVSQVKGISRQKQLLIAEGLFTPKNKNKFVPISEDDFKNSKRNLKNIRTDFTKEYNEAYKDELNILSTIDDCNNNISKSFVNIDYQKLNTLLKDQFYNHNLFELNKCVINQLLISKYGYIHYINNVKVIKREDKEKEQNQIVSFVNFDNFVIPSMTIKYDLNEYNLQEGVIGLIAINQLRKILPTFVWTYGFTKCSAPIYNTKGDIILSACDEYVKFPKKLVQEEKGEYIGLITEKIDGQSLESFIKNKLMTEEHFLSTLLLIIYSLQEAYKRFKFVHRDLHLENIIMRDLNKTSYVKIPGTNKYINTFKAIPTIFDFGMSSVVIKNKLFGNYDFMEFGLDPRKGGIMIDIIKFLVNASTISTNPIIERLLLLIFKDLKVVDRVYDNYGYLPDSDIIDNFDINIILNEIYLMLHELGYDWIITDKPEGQILLSTENKEYINEHKIKEILFTRKSITSAIDLEFYINKSELSSSEIDEIKKYINLYFKSLQTERSPSENITNITCVNKFFQLNNKLYEAKLIYNLLSDLIKFHKISDIDDIYINLEKYINKESYILDLYRKKARILNSSFRAPRAINTKLKNYLLDIQNI
jgi:hypothetical protein